MIRKILFLVFCIFMLFQFKSSFIAVESGIASLKKELATLQNEGEVLSAEWKIVTEPSRIQHLCLKHLRLKQTDPFQIKTVQKYKEKNIYIVNKRKIKKF